jgi:hypothetical protein
MLLWPLLNAVTLTSVLSNALYTFAVYAGLAGGPLRKAWVRVPLALLLWSAIVYMVAVLPPWFGENGGVPALLTIQTPAVISALAGAFYCWHQSKSAAIRQAFKLLSISGVLLCSAMGVSLIEVVYGKAHQARFFGIVPVYHIVIHLLEQVGIYLYGVGVSVIEHCMLRPVEVGRPRLETIFGCLPYLAITVEDAAGVVDEPVRRSARLKRE